MRKTFGTVPILTSNEFPSSRRVMPAAHKGQLFLDSSSGTYYQAKSAGPNAEWERVSFASDSGQSGELAIIEDPDLIGFAKISLS